MGPPPAATLRDAFEEFPGLHQFVQAVPLEVHCLTTIRYEAPEPLDAYIERRPVLEDPYLAA